MKTTEQDSNFATPKSLKNAQKLARLYNEPAVIWWDSDYSKQRVCRLSYYESGEGVAFIDESDVISIIE